MITTIIGYIGIIGVFMWREYQHDRERKDLYNRLTARSAGEYLSMQNKTPPKGRNFVKRGYMDSVDEMYRGD